MLRQECPDIKDFETCKKQKKAKKKVELKFAI